MSTALASTNVDDSERDEIMGWIHEGAGGHEGWVANVLADGRVAGGSTGGEVIVHELTGDDVVAGREVRRFEGSDHVDVVVPWDQVATWQVRCECGWAGGEQPAKVAPGSPADGYRDCDGFPDIEAAFHREWSAHIKPVVALHDVAHLTDQLRELDDRLDDKVRLARAAGASWTEVGRAAGLSKQGAQQRWGESQESELPAQRQN